MTERSYHCGHIVAKMAVRRMLDGTRCIRLTCGAKVCRHRCAISLTIPAAQSSVSDERLADLLSSHCNKLAELVRGQKVMRDGLTARQSSAVK